MKRLAAGVCALVIAAMAQMPLPAHADTYRYWSYWVGGDGWSYSSRGPGFRVPPDGGVEGWRFVVSPKDGSQASPPATAATFDQLCPGQPPAPEGQKRVAVVIDPGPSGIAPVGETAPQRSITCVVAPTTDNGLRVLQRVAQLRFHSSGLICGIAGFPASECPGQTTSRPASSAPASSAPTVPPATVPTPDDVTAPQTRSTNPPNSPTPTPSTRTPTATDTPSPVALALPESEEPTAESGPPPWVAAIGVTMIAALLGLGILVRRGRG